MAVCNHPSLPEEEVPPGMVRLLGGQLVTEAEQRQVIPPPGSGTASRARGEDPGVPASFFADACPCAQAQVAELRAQLLVEREARLRAESYAAGVSHGWERAVALLAPAAGPRAAPAPAAVPPSTTLVSPVTQAAPDVTQAQRDTPHPSVTVSVTPEVEGGGGEVKALENPKPATLRKRLERARKAQRDSVTTSVTPQKSPLPPPPSASETRGALVAVTQDARKVRDSQRDVRGLVREHRKPDSLPVDVRELREAWNAMALAHGFPAWGERTSRRMLEDALDALGRHPLDEWRRVFALVPRSPACRGELSNRLRANVVWVLGWTRAGLEVAEQLLGGAWSLDPERTLASPHEEPGAAMCREDVPEGTEAARAWAQVLGAMRGDGKSYTADHLQRSRAVAIEEESLVVALPDRFALDWVQDTCRGLLDGYTRRLALAGVRFVVEGQDGDEQPPESAPPAALAAPGDTLPFELPPQGPQTESLRDGVERVFREVKGCEYSWGHFDDNATRTLLSLAGSGGVPEVLRRWSHGLRANFKQRCDTLANLVRKWNDNATPEARPSSARAPGRPLNDDDYQEGVVDSL